MRDAVELILDGLVELEEEFGSRLEWKGMDVPCAGGSELRGKRLDLGGWVFHADCVVAMRAELFDRANRPEPRQLCVYRSAPGGIGRTWRIDGVRVLFDAVLILECNDPNQPA